MKSGRTDSSSSSTRLEFIRCFQNTIYSTDQKLCKSWWSPPLPISTKVSGKKSLPRLVQHMSDIAAGLWCICSCLSVFGPYSPPWTALHFKPLMQCVTIAMSMFFRMSCLHFVRCSIPGSYETVLNEAESVVADTTVS